MCTVLLPFGSKHWDNWSVLHFVGIRILLLAQLLLDWIGIVSIELRLQWNSVVFCERSHTGWFTNQLFKVLLCSFLTSWAASTFRVSQRIKMCKGCVGDFQAIGYLGPFSWTSPWDLLSSRDSCWRKRRDVLLFILCQLGDVVLELCLLFPTMVQGMLCW